MRKVTMVVPVLMINCHVSEKPKMGPVTPQVMMMVMAMTKAMGLPVAVAAHLENLVNSLSMSLSFAVLYRFRGLLPVTVLPLSRWATGCEERAGHAPPLRLLSIALEELFGELHLGNVLADVAVVTN